MTRIIMPKNPVFGQRHTHGDYTYSWDGTKWTSINAGVRNIFNTQEDLECSTVLLGEWVLVVGNKQEYVIEASSSGVGSIAICNGTYANEYTSAKTDTYTAHLSATGNIHGLTVTDLNLENVANIPSTNWVEGDAILDDVNMSVSGAQNLITVELVNVYGAIGAVTSVTTSLDNRVTVTEVSITSLDGRVATLEGSDLTDIEDILDQHTLTIASLQISTTALEARADETDTEITDVTDRLDVLEGLGVAQNTIDIANNSSDISTNTGDISTLVTRADATDVSATALDTRVGVLEGTDISPQLDALRDAMFPVGSVYITVSSTNPSSFLGGTWLAYSEGKVLVGVGSYNDGTDSKVFTGSSVGGKYNTTLTEAQLPSHDHPDTFSVDGGGEHTHTATANNTGLMSKGGTTNSAFESGTGGNFYKDTVITNSTAPDHGHTLSGAIGNAGSGQAHNNIQPYQTVYYWQCVSR